MLYDFWHPSVEVTVEQEGVKRQVEIHICGAKRSGKSTLAENLLPQLARFGFKPVVIDVDRVRRAIFGDEDMLAKIGSPENTRMHACAMRAIFKLLIPTSLVAGGSPIVTATHSRRENYYEAARIARDHGVQFRFIILETPETEELVRRSRIGSESDASDTDDLTRGDQFESFQASLDRLSRSYGSDFEEAHIKITQSNPQEMAANALLYILEGLT